MPAAAEISIQQQQQERRQQIRNVKGKTRIGNCSVKREWESGQRNVCIHVYVCVQKNFCLCRDFRFERNCLSAAWWGERVGDLLRYDWACGIGNARQGEWGRLEKWPRKLNSQAGEHPVYLPIIYRLFMRTVDFKIMTLVVKADLCTKSYR